MDRTGEGSQSAEPKKKSKRGLELREASFQDHDQIARLEARYGLYTTNYEQWSHLWLGNPFYRSLEDTWSIGWVLENESGRIVGSIGNIPTMYEFQGRRVVAASSHAWVADPEYRSASLLLLDHLINQRHVDLYLTNTVGVTSAAAVSAFQCTRVPVGVWDGAAFWITHRQGFFESLLVRKDYPLAKLLSYPLSAVVFLSEQLTRKALDTGEVEVKACPGFDERFDDFWADLRSHNPHVLLAVRTREVLEWHYKYALLSNRLWIATVVDGSQIVAYAIFDRKDNPKFGLKRVRLVDFQSLDGRTALLPTFLGWALRKCRDESIHMLESVGGWLDKGQVVDTIAPYRRTLPAWSYLYRANNPALAESLSDRRVWAPSLYDGDASLVH